MSWWRRFANGRIRAPLAVVDTDSPDGSESRPFVFRDYSSEPIKYQCAGCGLWFIEGDTALMHRQPVGSSGGYWYQPRCQPCASRYSREQWLERVRTRRAAWERIQHER